MKKPKQISTYIRLACLFIMATAVAAAQDPQLYQIKWQYHGNTGYFAPFIDSEAAAQQRLLLAKNGNPYARVSLVVPEKKPYRATAPQLQDVSARTRRLYLLSLGAFNAVNTLDITSSFGKRELNPLLAGNGQRFDMGSVAKKLAMVGAIDATQIFALRRQPSAMKRLALANLVMTGVLAGVVAHNYGVSAKR